MATGRWLRVLGVVGTAAVVTLASLSSVAAAEKAGAPAAPAPGWSTETVDSAGSVGFYSSLAFSPVTGFPAIGYSDEGKDDVKLAVWNGASWDVQTVDASKNIYTGISLAYDAVGNPALSYGWGKLKYAHWTGSAWTIETIERGNAYNNVTSLVFKDGQPSIAYHVGSKLKLARLVGSSWVTEVVDTGGAYVSLAYAPDGNPSIAYSDNGLKFAHKTGSTWTIQTVETGVTGYGVFASLAYDPLTGYPTLAHSNGSNTGGVRFLRWDGFQWVLEIAAAGKSTHSSLAYDAAGIAAISYDFAPGTQTNQLWLARRTGCSGTCWDTQLVEDVAPSTLAWRTSLAFAPTGAAAISYGNFTARDLKFATQVPVP